MNHLSIGRAGKHAIHALLAYAVLLGSAHANNVSVGPGCTFSDLPALIDDIKNHTVQGVDEIHLLTTYESPPIDTTGIVVYIGGGYDNCDDAQPTPGHRTVITSHGQTRKSVVKVQGGSNNNSILNLHDVEITGGNAANGSDGNGGGISFDGHGELDLTNVVVDNNYADNGGGISVDPDGNTTGVNFDGSSIVTLSGVQILNNRTHFDGAGIRIRNTHSDYWPHLYILKDALSPLMVFSENEAGRDQNGQRIPPFTGHGGGLDLENAYADISSTTANHAPLFTANQADYGGAISIQSAHARIFTTVPTETVSMQFNTAYAQGGAIFSGGDANAAALCAFGYDLGFNTAEDGAAIYAGSFTFTDLVYTGLGGDNASQFHCGHDDATVTLGAVYPAIRSQLQENTAHFGSVVTIGDDSFFVAEFLEIGFNNVGPGAGNVVNVSSSSQEFFSALGNCLINGNVSTSSVLKSDRPLALDSCTLSRNRVDSGAVIESSDKVRVQRSISWHPAWTILGTVIPEVPTLLHSGSSPVEFTDDITQDSPTADVITKTDCSSDDPLFVTDTDYHLTSASPAIDYTNAHLYQNDLDGNYRGVAVNHPDTPYDIGAFERQSGAPPITFPPDETFDELGGPGNPNGALPVGWVSDTWGTTTRPDEGTLAAHTIIFASGEDNTLTTPAVFDVENAVLTFRHSFLVPDPTVAAALEIDIGATGDFVDIVEAGGAFVNGGYNSTLQDATNPIGAGRSVWTGDSAGYQTVVVKLPASANGRNVKLRWRLASGFGSTGDYLIDTIHIDLDVPVSDMIFADGFEPGPN